MNKVLLTGGAGYIGSHTIIELINAGYQVVVIDNLVNSSAESLRRVQEITGQEVTFANSLNFFWSFFRKAKSCISVINIRV